MGSSPAGGIPDRRERLPRGSRIRRGAEIRSLLRKGARARSAHLNVFAAPAPHSAPRFGTIVPRYGRNAVARNLLRRRLREIGRRGVLPELARRGCAVDLLVRARPGAYAARFPELEAELMRLSEGLCPDGSFLR